MEQRAEKKIYMEKLGKRAVSAKETVAFLNVIQRQEGAHPGGRCAGWHNRHI